MLKFVLAFALLSTSALADDCTLVVDAMMKMTTVPSHQVAKNMTDNKSRQIETVVIGKDMYVNTSGVWAKKPFDAAKTAQEQKAYYQGATCAAGKTSTVDDEPIRIYTIATPTENLELWISTASGLPVRQTINKSGEIRQIEFEYRGVKPPL